MDDFNEYELAMYSLFLSNDQDNSQDNSDDEYEYEE